MEKKKKTHRPSVRRRSAESVNKFVRSFAHPVAGEGSRSSPLPGLPPTL